MSNVIWFAMFILYTASRLFICPLARLIIFIHNLVTLGAHLRPWFVPHGSPFEMLDIKRLD